MTALANRKHEIFSQELAAGTPLLQAYLRAGYRESYSARFNASRLRNTPPVRGRVTEIQSVSANFSSISADYVRHELLDYLTCDPKDLYVEDPGHPGRLLLRPLEALPDRVRKAIVRIKVDPLTGRPTEIILAEKTSVATALLRSLPGGMSPSTVINATATAAAGVEIADMSSAELARRISAIIEDAAHSGEMIEAVPLADAPAPELPPAAAVTPQPRETAMAALSDRVEAAVDRVITLAEEVEDDPRTSRQLVARLREIARVIEEDLEDAG
jgi:hypothetical protein